MLVKDVVYVTAELRLCRRKENDVIADPFQVSHEMRREQHREAAVGHGLGE